MVILEKPNRTELGKVLAEHGADVRRLEFVAWLILHQRHPEWDGVRPLANAQPGTRREERNVRLKE